MRDVSVRARASDAVARRSPHVAHRARPAPRTSSVALSRAARRVLSKSTKTSLLKLLLSLRSDRRFPILVLAQLPFLRPNARFQLHTRRENRGKNRVDLHAERRIQRSMTERGSE